MCIKSKIQINFKFNSQASVLENLALWSAIFTAGALTLTTTINAIFFILTLLLYYASGDWREKFTYIWQNRVAGNLLLLLGLFLIGVLYTQAPHEEVMLTLTKYSKVFLAILFLPILRDEKVRKYAINAFLCGIVFLLLLSYLRYFHIINLPNAKGISEVLHNSIDFNFLISFGTYLLLLKFWQVKNTACWQKWIYLLLIGLATYNTFFMTVGRTGYIIFLVLLGLFCVQQLKMKQLLIAFIGIIVLCTSVFLFSPTFKQRFDDFKLDLYELQHQHNSYTSVGLRLTFLKNGLSLIQKNLWFGAGTGSYHTLYKANFGDISNFEIKDLNNEYVHVDNFETRNPHNEYIHITVQFGLFGLMLLLFNFASQLWYSRKLSVPFANIAQAIVVAIMIGSLANSLLMNSVQGHLYAYFMALVFANLNTERLKRVIRI